MDHNTATYRPKRPPDVHRLGRSPGYPDKSPDQQSARKRRRYHQLHLANLAQHVGQRTVQDDPMVPITSNYVRLLQSDSPALLGRPYLQEKRLERLSALNQSPLMGPQVQRCLQGRSHCSHSLVCWACGSTCPCSLPAVNFCRIVSQI